LFGTGNGLGCWNAGFFAADADPVACAAIAIVVLLFAWSIGLLAKD
jgi:hypothetical protein